MECTWSQYVFPQGAMNPSTIEGSIEIPIRPMIGEEIEVKGKWIKIKSIRHIKTGLHLILENEVQASGW